MIPSLEALDSQARFSTEGATPVIGARKAPEEAERPSPPLVALPLGASARITRVRCDTDEAAWLAAVGIGAGVSLTVLRRAPFGGPLHVRTCSDGEFALDRHLAARIDVEPAGDPGRGVP